MKKMMVMAGLVMLAAAAGAQVSFQDHVTFAKAHKLGAREMAFANVCGVDAATAKIVNGHSLDETFTFAPVDGVADASDAQVDSYGSAQVFYVGGKARMLILWEAIMDVGSYSNEMFCMDDAFKPIAQETLNTNEPPGDAKHTWRHIKRVIFLPDGSQKVTFDKFVTKAGTAVAVAPKLDKDSTFQANNVMGFDTAKQIVVKLPLK